MIFRYPQLTIVNCWRLKFCQIMIKNSSLSFKISSNESINRHPLPFSDVLFLFFVIYKLVVLCNELNFFFDIRRFQVLYFPNFIFCTLKIICHLVWKDLSCLRYLYIIGFCTCNCYCYSNEFRNFSIRNSWSFRHIYTL